jgi:hypothetical protein
MVLLIIRYLRPDQIILQNVSVPISCHQTPDMCSRNRNQVSHVFKCRMQHWGGGVCGRGPGDEK